jgi:3-hydroxyacyl-CoA dehydrogenase
MICEVGRYGQKTAAGWYDYKPGDRTPYPSPVVTDILDKHRKELGITPRAISDEEIVQRLMYALVNEGALILEEGIAMRAVDIDMIYMTGYGVPQYLGGPMFWADRRGLANVVKAMEGFAANPHADPGFWKPAPLLAKLAAEGKTFN